MATSAHHRKKAHRGHRHGRGHGRSHGRSQHEGGVEEEEEEEEEEEAIADNSIDRGANKDNKFEKFERWLRINGARFPLLELRRYRDAGLGRDDDDDNNEGDDSSKDEGVSKEKKDCGCIGAMMSLDGLDASRPRPTAEKNAKKGKDLCHLCHLRCPRHCNGGRGGVVGGGGDIDCRSVCVFNPRISRIFF